MQASASGALCTPSTLGEMPCSWWHVSFLLNSLPNLCYTYFWIICQCSIHRCWIQTFSSRRDFCNSGKGRAFQCTGWGLLPGHPLNLSLACIIKVSWDHAIILRIPFKINFSNILLKNLFSTWKVNLLLSLSFLVHSLIMYYIVERHITWKNITLKIW